MMTQAKRIPSLDGLRAISIGLVLFSHLMWGQGVELNSYISGNLGVRIFFVISGFLITSILLEEWHRNSTISLPKFYFRRLLRIFPAYYFYLFSVIFWYLFAGDRSLFVLIPSFAYVSNYFFWNNPWELGHTWSLAVEEQFYLLFPALLLFLGAYRARTFLVFVVLVVPILRLLTVAYFQVSDPQTIFRINFYFHNNMDILASGCLLAMYRNELHSSPTYKRFLTSRAAFIGLVLLIPFIGFNSHWVYLFNGVGMTLLNLSIVACIDWLMINSESVYGRILNFGPVRFFGVLSYSIYLWQQPFLKYDEYQWWTHFPFNLIGLMLFALFSYYAIETTFLELRRTWEKKLFSHSRKSLLQTDP